MWGRRGVCIGYLRAHRTHLRFGELPGLEMQGATRVSLAGCGLMVRAVGSAAARIPKTAAARCLGQLLAAHQPGAWTFRRVLAIAAFLSGG